MSEPAMEEPAPSIKVLLADDEELVRVALSGLLAREAGIEVVAEAATGRQAVDLALRHRPDVAVIDLQMPELDGIEVVTERGRVLPNCGCVVLTGHGRPLRPPSTSDPLADPPPACEPTAPKRHKGSPRADK